MSRFYESLLKEINDVLTEYGRSALLKTRLKSGTTYNPTLTETSVPITVVSDNYRSDLIDGSVIKQGDIQYFINCDQAIDQSNLIVDGGETYVIVDVQLIRPGDTNLLYIIQARK